MNVLVEENSLVAIANAIRTKNGGSNTYTPSQMAAAIDDLQVGGGATLIEKTITEEGTYSAASDNADGYSKVINNIPWYIVPYAFDLHPNGYAMNSKWMINGSTVNYSDVYRVKSGHRYYATLGDTRGTRWRIIITRDDPTPCDTELSAYSGMIANVSNPGARANVTFTAGTDGYLIITKDNAGKANVPTYLFDITKA